MLEEAAVSVLSDYPWRETHGKHLTIWMQFYFLIALVLGVHTKSSEGNGFIISNTDHKSRWRKSQPGDMK